MENIKQFWDSHSVIQAKTNIDSFIPPNAGWNFVSFSDNKTSRVDEYDNSGKWLLFVQDEIFVETFRELAKMAKNMELTRSFKASGSGDASGFHVFCVYCPDYRNIEFVRKIAHTLLKHRFIDRFGYGYKDGTKAIFFKTDDATRYKSKSAGESLTLFKYTDKGELFVKEFDTNGKPIWRVVETNTPRIVENFDEHLVYLKTKESDLV